MARMQLKGKREQSTGFFGSENGDHEHVLVRVRLQGGRGHRWPIVAGASGQSASQDRKREAGAAAVYYYREILLYLGKKVTRNSGVQTLIQASDICLSLTVVLQPHNHLGKAFPIVLFRDFSTT